MSISKPSKGKKGMSFWVNLLLMIAVLIAIPAFAFNLLGMYTHHGEQIEVPDVRTMSMKRAKTVLERYGFQVVISDSIETKEVRPGAVIDQTPKAGSIIKSGRIIYLTTRCENEVLIEIPKLVGEHTLREAKVILSNLGFRFTADSAIVGMEKGYLVGIYQGSKRLHSGDKVSKSVALTMYVGGGIVDSIETDTVQEEIEYDPNFE